MNNRTQAEVIINGKQYSIIGCESEEYLQKVASYINSKYSEIRAQKWFKEVSPDMREVVLQINIADDYLDRHNVNASILHQEFGQCVPLTLQFCVLYIYPGHNR